MTNGESMFLSPDWRPVHTERNISNVVGPVEPLHFRYHLPEDIDSHLFSKYTSIYFKVSCDDFISDRLVLIHRYLSL